MSVGMFGHVGVGVESASNPAATTTYSATIVDYIPIVSESLQVRPDILASNAIINSFDRQTSRVGLKRIEGDISVEVHPETIGYLLRTVFDATTSWIGRAGPFTPASNAAVSEHRFVTQRQLFHEGSGSHVPTMTFEIFRGPAFTQGTSFVYYNCGGNRLELSLEAGNVLLATVGFIGRGHGFLARTTPVAPIPDAYVWDGASASLDGVGKPHFESFTVVVDNQLEGVPALDGRDSYDLIWRNGFRECTASGRMSFRDFADYQRFLAGSEGLLRLVLDGRRVIGTSSNPVNRHRLVIEAPRFAYTAYPIAIAGPQRESVDWTANLYTDNTSGYALQIHVINERLAPYTVNTTG